MSMSTGAGLVGYATATFSQNAGKLTAKWTTEEVSPALYPATLAFLTGFNTAVDTLVHAEQSFIRLLSPANASFIMPQWSLISSATYGPGVQYRTEVFVEGKYARVLTYNDTTGAIVSYNYVYDTDMQARMGPKAFYEHIDNKLDYTLVTAKAVPIGGFGGWPTLDILKETKFPTDADGFVAGTWGSGGGATWIAANNLQIDTTGSYGTGSKSPIGPVITDDRIWVSFDVLSGNIVGNNLVTIGQPAGPIGSITPIVPDATGRFSTVLTVTADNADAFFQIAGDGTTTSINIANLLILKNPPLSMSDDAAMFADSPAPSGFHWEFVTVDGVRQTLNGVYVVTLVAD